MPMSIFREERAKAGLPIDRLSLFVASRADNVGQSSDLATQDMIDAINESLEELNDEEHNDSSIRENIFIDHFGKYGHGRMRCMGRGPTITSMFGRGAFSSSSQMNLQHMVDELELRLVSQKEEFQRLFDTQREANRLATEALIAKIMAQFQAASPSSIVPTGSSRHPAQFTSSSDGANVHSVQ